MSSWPRLGALAALLVAAAAAPVLSAGKPALPKTDPAPAMTGISGMRGMSGITGIGRAATPAEVAAWDIDVRPDFKGLPAGSGSVAKGQDVWEARCASCHGVFGESNQFFTPLVGGTTPQDIQTGRVARLNDPAYPGRTTLMKVPTVSTLWDYIRRAMPWNAPKSLSNDEVYAVTAFLLNLGGVMADGDTLSDRNIAEVQQRMPNRNGMTLDHGMWPGRGMGNGGRPDVVAKACMTDCAAVPRIASQLPDFARDHHGNLADQQRLVGPQLGAVTDDAAVVQARPAPPAAASAALALTAKHYCSSCHSVDTRIVGPAFKDIADRYAGRGEPGVDQLMLHIRNGGQGRWGTLVMPAQTLPEADARAIARWLADGAPR